MKDDDIIQKAFVEDWVLITNDKDFGGKIYRDRLPHHGVILLRLQDERAAIKIEIIKKVLRTYSNQISGRFVVATETKVRFGKGFPI